MQKRKIKQTIAVGRQSLVIGILILAITAVVGNILSTYTATYMQIISTGVSILGWVAFWRPMETLIFGWWPEYVTGEVLLRLSRLTVDLLHVTQV